MKPAALEVVLAQKRGRPAREGGTVFSFLFGAGARAGFSFFPFFVVFFLFSDDDPGARLR